MRIIVKNIKVNHYVCERCGREWQERMWITKCPKHGEFCADCSISENGEKLVCPDCRSEMARDIQTITYPYVEIKKDFAGVWIGSIST